MIVNLAVERTGISMVIVILLIPIPLILIPLILIPLILIPLILILAEIDFLYWPFDANDSSAIIYF